MEKISKKYIPNKFGDKSTAIKESGGFKEFYSLWENIKNKKPFMLGRLRVIITNFCNLSCEYCFNEGVKKNADFINPKDLDFVLKSINKKIKDIKITGGEPLLHPQIEEVLGICCKYKSTSITTNGVLLKKFAPILNKSKIDYIRLTLDKPDFKNFRAGISNPEKFNLIKEGVKSITKPIAINMVITKNNINDVDGMIAFCEDMGIKKLSLISLIKYNDYVDSVYVSPLEMEEKLNKMSTSYKMVSNSRKSYKLKNIKIDLVWQYCTLGCNICKTDGFIRVTTNNKFKYCLGDKSEISFKKELDDRNGKGLMKKFEEAISSLGNFSD